MENCANCGKKVDDHQVELCIECEAGLCTECFNVDGGYCKECIELGMNEDNE